MASTYLYKTPSSAGNRKTFTISTWVKRSQITGSSSNIIFSAGSSAANRSSLQFTNDTIYFYNEISDVFEALITNRLFRDTSAWYHIVVSVDTTQATESNRVKLYINGEQETSFSTSNYPSQNDDYFFSNNIIHRVGEMSWNTGLAFDGSMAHFHFIDGTAYDADTFGETDATTGIWKPKTAPSVTYGTNGFFLKFENSGSMGTDSSGNANNFTVNGTLTQTEDTPSNVFATLNALAKSTGRGVLSNGNLTYAGTDTNWSAISSTLGVSTGKYYAEFKFSSSTGNDINVGIQAESTIYNQMADTDHYLGKQSANYGYFGNGNKVNNASSTSYGSSFTNNDIIGLALDLDNGAIWFSKNGTWQNSATIAEIEAGTTTNAAFTGLSGTFFIGLSTYKTGNANFGNGYFGTTAVSSAQNPDDGIGIFEYDVPTGYRALCTKSINAEEYS